MSTVNRRCRFSQQPRHGAPNPNRMRFAVLVSCLPRAAVTWKLPALQGVREHTFMFKSIEDAQALRQRVCECFERSALPGTSDEVC